MVSSNLNFVLQPKQLIKGVVRKQTVLKNLHNIIEETSLKESNISRQIEYAIEFTKICDVPILVTSLVFSLKYLPSSNFSFLFKPLFFFMFLQLLTYKSY